MKLSKLITELNILEKWLEKRDYGDAPIEVYDKHGNEIENIKFSIDLERNVVVLD